MLNQKEKNSSTKHPRNLGDYEKTTLKIIGMKKEKKPRLKKQEKKIVFFFFFFGLLRQGFSV